GPGRAPTASRRTAVPTAARAGHGRSQRAGPRLRTGAGTPLQQPADHEQRNHGFQLESLRLATRRMAPVAQVAADIHVREQAGVLEHVADPALMRRHVDAADAVVQHPAIDADVTGAWAHPA